MNTQQQRKMNGAGYLFMGLLITALCILLIVFAFQTYFLVDTLFPSDNIFMKVVTVFSFDGCCIIYAGLDLFYHFKWQHSKNLTNIMWGATFIGSLICTVAYMNLSSDHLLHQIVNINLLYTAYAIVTVVFAGNIVAITFLVKKEYVAWLEWKYGGAVIAPVTTPANVHPHAVPTEELHPTVENNSNGHQPKNLSRSTL